MSQMTAEDAKEAFITSYEDNIDQEFVDSINWEAVINANETFDGQVMLDLTTIDEVGNFGSEVLDVLTSYVPYPEN